MSNFAKKRSVQVWLVLLAFLFGVLAPTVTRALNSGISGDGTVEICTSSGVKVVKLAGLGGEQSAPSKMKLDQCMYCILYGDAHALLGDDFVVRRARVNFDVYSPLYFSADHQLYTWSVAYPRAPPVFA